MIFVKNMDDQHKPTRRSFIKQASFLSAAAVAVPAALDGFPSAAPQDQGNGFIFLFQGDSITDGNRSHNMDWNHVMGHGYAYLVASRLWYDLPAKGFHFFNRGVSGNKVTDLAARWQEDTIAIKPDVLSILIGANETLAAVSGDKNFTASGYETGYRDLLDQTKQQLPATQLVICEPFVLPVGRVKDKQEAYESEITPRQLAAKKLSDEFGAIYVPLQSAFNKALQRAPAEYWIWDGIHPMPGGHELIAREWIKQVGKKLKFIG